MHPVLFQFGTFRIYAYGFFIAVGFVSAVVLATLKIRKPNTGISFENIVDLFFYTVLSALIGSRVLFVLINFDLYRNHPMRIFKIWEGGLVFYGGLALAVMVAFWYMRWNRLPVWKLADLVGHSLFFYVILYEEKISEIQSWLFLKSLNILIRS